MRDLKPVCRELFELVNEKMLNFISASESNGAFTINLKATRPHSASRGFKDSIGDVIFGKKERSYDAWENIR